ncbi:MAG: hypothetical protein R3F65_03800 [bacterium]
MPRREPHALRPLPRPRDRRQRHRRRLRPPRRRVRPRRRSHLRRSRRRQHRRRTHHPLQPPPRPPRHGPPPPPDERLFTRPHCGAWNQSCEAIPGALDVRCVDRTGAPDCPAPGPNPIAECATCEPIWPDAAPGPRPKARKPVEPADRCLDGVDDDGNGIIDDGPHCQTLVAVVAQPECHGRTPGPGCPPLEVPLPDIYPGPRP